MIWLFPLGLVIGFCFAIPIFLILNQHIKWLREREECWYDKYRKESDTLFNERMHFLSLFKPTDETKRNPGD